MLGLTDVASGTATVTLLYRKGVIARRIGIAPESLSRALARLSELGVKTDGDAVIIGDVEKLRQFSAG